MSGIAAVEVVRDEAGAVAGLEALAAEAYAEAGRGASMPPGWRPFGLFQSIPYAAFVEGRLEGYAVIRPAEGMDAIDFLYVRKRARSLPVEDALLARAVADLKGFGRTKIIYAGYSWWRAPFPAALAEGFRRAGFGRFEGVFLGRPVDPAEPSPPPPPPGIEYAEWDDARFDEVCEMMLRTPEPGALYWDMGLCRRSILNAASPVPPLFPHGLGRLALLAPPGEDGRKRVVGFCLSTAHGYINHVYTDRAHQGKGIASGLIRHVLRAHAALGIARSTILTHDTNPRAIAVYRRLGFTVEFTFPQFFLKH